MKRGTKWKELSKDGLRWKWQDIITS